MTEANKISTAEPEGQRRAATFFGRLAQAFRTQNWGAVMIEIGIVVIGVFIGLQANNWNEQRKQDDRFRTSLREVYRKVLGTTFHRDALADRLQYQIVMIDSLRRYPNAVDPRRVPAIVQILDDYGLGDRGVTLQLGSFELAPANKAGDEIVEAMRWIEVVSSFEADALARYDLVGRMGRHLQENAIPLGVYAEGAAYTDFVDANSRTEYTKGQLERAVSLLADEAFVADLMTVETLKRYFLRSNDPKRETVENFLALVRGYMDGVDLSIRRMEIIGDAIPESGWSRGVPMANVSEDDSVWEIEQDFVDGFVKFRADQDWVLNWGRGDFDADKLAFAGGNIPVRAGRYRVRIDIREHTMRFTRLGD